jgi:hypothetical protein
MSIVRPAATAEVRDARNRRTIPAWVYVAGLGVAAIAATGYRLLTVGPSVLNWVVFSLAVIIGISYLAAVIYLECTAPAEEERLRGQLDHLGSRIEKLQQAIQDLPDDTVVSDDSSPIDRHVAK